MQKLIMFATCEKMMFIFSMQANEGQDEMVQAYTFSNQSNSVSDETLKEMWLTHHKYMEMKTQPFTLQYLAYGKTVWELGYYEYLPPLLKNLKEPNPFPDDVNFVTLMDLQRLAGRNDSPPRFYKEYFYKLFRKRLLNFEMEEAKCVFCWLEMNNMKVELHPPEPIPFIKCKIKRKPRHFMHYFFVNNLVKCRPQKRKCVLNGT